MAARARSGGRVLDAAAPKVPAEDAYRRQIEQHVSRAELAALAEPGALDTFGMLALLWVELVALLAAANLLGRIPLAWAVLPAVLLIVGIATRINALNVVIHEGSHGFLARRRVVNDRLCNMAASWWMLHSVEEYRPAHRLHHLYLHQARDPDLDQYLFADTPGALTRLVLEDIIGLTAIRRARVLISAANGPDQALSGDSSVRAIRNLFGKAAAQLILLGQFVIFQGLVRGVIFYATFWLVPLLCVFPVLKRLKAITEHFDPHLLSGRSDVWIARTSSASWVQDHVVGARMEYHFEHHVLPAIPFRGLKRLHELLERDGFFADTAVDDPSPIMSGGYVHFLSSLPVVETFDPSSEAVA